MPVPAIPPELVETILRELPPSDAATIPALLACTLVSHSFYSIATQDSLWSPTARSCWTFGRLPTYARLSNEEDRREMKLAFPREKHSRKSVLERISARPTIKRIITRHLEALLAEPSNKIPHVLAIVELGETNAIPFLDELAFMEDDRLFPDDWLARRYWARQARGAISRRRAVAVWKRIDEGWDTTISFCKGIFAFDAFRGTQNLDEVRPALTLSKARAHRCSAVAKIEKQLSWSAYLFGEMFPFMEKHEHEGFGDWRSTPQLGAIMERLFLRGALKLSPTPDPNFHLTVDQFFPHHTVSRIRQLDGHDAAMLSQSPNPDDTAMGHPSVFSALLCAIAPRQTLGSVLVRPVQLSERGIAVAVAWEGSKPIPSDDWVYISPVPTRSFTQAAIVERYRYLCEAAHPFIKNLSLGAYAGRTPSRDLVSQYAHDIIEVLLSEGPSLTEDATTSAYASRLVHLIITPSDRVYYDGRHPSVISLEASLSSVADVVATRYPRDAELVLRDILPRCDLGLEAKKPHHEKLIELQLKDAQVTITRRRTELAVEPRFRVGDWVGIGDRQDEDLYVVVGWDATFFTKETIKELVGLEGTDDPLMVAMLRELRLGTEGESSVRYMYYLLDSQGATEAFLDTSSLRALISVEKGDLDDFVKLHDVGKYFKRIDWSGDRPRFILADDHAKLYPDD